MGSSFEKSQTRRVFNWYVGVLLSEGLWFWGKSQGPMAQSGTGFVRDLNQGSIIWTSHGTMLRCAPEQLQPVSRDLQEVDETVNGPFSPDEFLKGKHIYQDLFGEKDDLTHEVEDDEESVWQKDLDNMEILIDKSIEKPCKISWTEACETHRKAKSRSDCRSPEP